MNPLDDAISKLKMTKQKGIALYVIENANYIFSGHVGFEV